jgi:hypothetical protein
MDSSLIELVVRHHKLSMKIALIALGLSALGLLLQGCSRVGLSPLCVPLGGGADYISYLTLSGEVLALIWLRWSLRSAEKLEELNDSSPKAAFNLYLKIWQPIQVFGILVTVGAVLMLSPALVLLMMGVPGVATNFAIYGGAWLYFRARKLHRNITWSRSPEVTDEGSISEPRIEPVAGIIPLIVSAALLLLNIIVEISFVAQIRAMPSFFEKHSLLDSSLSLNMGFSGIADIAFGGSIGIAMLIYAIKIRRSLPKNRLLMIAVLTVLQLALVSGSLAPIVARWLGPSEAGVHTKKQMVAAAKTLAFIKSKPIPDGFLKDNSGYPSEEVNVSWMIFTDHLNAANHGVICSQVINYAQSLGATKWIDRSTMNIGSVADSPKTLNACSTAMQSYQHLKVPRTTVGSEAFILAGTARGGAKSPIKLSLTFHKNGTSSEHPNTVDYSVEIWTTYGEDPLTKTGGLSQGTVEINDLLTLIGQERLAAPNRNPTDPRFVREILKLYRHKIAIQVVETKPGLANRLELTNSDGSHMCLAIDPWDEKREGFEDPGTGYGLGFQENLEDLKGFGNAVEGGC